ncbi:MAG: RNB domain-containing ribonuclease [Elusimicrobia bacterium]|nr:RNB domain-containing ribonuclease [Elusimicrobiota bacterium]
MDPKGAGDLDDAFYVEKGADGSFTWYLATADVAQYVKPGTPAFAAAAKVGNTFYSIDKDGVPEFPMNHPVVSKHVASLLAGKDSLGMITRMRFSPTGEFLLDQSDMFLGKVRVQGRYSYDQVAKLWEGGKDHGIAHVDQVSLARELAGKLSARDAARGKLNLSFMPVEHRPQADGTWKTEVVKEDPRESESHKLIEELKVYGNRVIATRLTRISSQFEVPHISRVHPEVEQAANDLLRDELKELGVPWPKEQTLWQYLAALKAREDISAERKEAAQILALRTRNPAIYAVEDTEGHEGLALQAGEYDHPSTPIRRFADMYNQSILEAYLAGRDPRVVRDAVEADLRRMGFADLAEYMQHLNGREQASKQMDLEVDAFMSVYELAKPENRGRTFSGYVKVVRKGRNAQAVVQLREMPVTITLEGERAEGLRLLDEVTVTVKGADAAELSVDAAVAKRR